jgi:predicted secreted hydrolase
MKEPVIRVVDLWKEYHENGQVVTQALRGANLEAAQELNTSGSTGVTYWGCAVDGKGSSAGQQVTCEGYVEMTGYAGSLGGLF